MNAKGSHLPVHGWLTEPELAFHPSRLQDRHPHPLVGLEKFGPFSRSLINHVIDPIRIAMVTPYGEQARIINLLAELERPHQPRERLGYLPPFPTFSRLFGVRAIPCDASLHIQLSSELDSELANSSKPHLVLAKALSDSLSTLGARRNEFDVLAILLPDRWEAGFTGGDDEDFDLHDYVKAVTASRGIPSQIVRETGAIHYPCRCSVMWRLGIALYTKAGGIPWILADADPELAYLGLAYAVKAPQLGDRKFVTCCSQVFDADGAGLEFIAYDTDDVRVERDNPYLSRADMQRLMSRSLALYQRRHAGRLPSRLIVHKSTDFRDEEIDGCFDMWPRSDGLELIQVQQDVSWRGVKIDPPKSRNQRGLPASFPVDRGTFQLLSGYDVLLWSQGNARQIVKHGNYFKEGKEIPHPLLLRRFAGQGGWRESCRHVLGLTKMNWNNDGLYDFLPVTLSYAQVLAQVVRRMPQIAPKPYEFRYFM